MKVLSFATLLMCVFSFVYSSPQSDDALSYVITPRGEINPLKANKALVEHFCKAFEGHQTQKLKLFLDANYKMDNIPNISSIQKGQYAILNHDIFAQMNVLHEAFPNFSVKTINMIAEGHQVWAYFQISGEHKGPFLGLQPTLRHVTFPLFMLFTIEGGKIQSLSESWNIFELTRQLGYIPL